MNTPNHVVPVVRFDWDAFAAHVERRRREHASRDELDAVARSLAAFRRWGVRPPASFLEQHAEAVAACRLRDN